MRPRSSSSVLFCCSTSPPAPRARSPGLPERLVLMRPGAIEQFSLEGIAAYATQSFSSVPPPALGPRCRRSPISSGSGAPRSRVGERRGASRFPGRSRIGRSPRGPSPHELARPRGGAVGRTARVAGRLHTIRSHGGTSFIDLEDASGHPAAAAHDPRARRGDLHPLAHRPRPGRHRRGGRGSPAVSRRGEPSLRIRSLELLAKAVSPPPEKFHGLKDPEERIRRRYLDLDVVGGRAGTIPSALLPDAGDPRILRRRGVPGGRDPDPLARRGQAPPRLPS